MPDRLEPAPVDLLEAYIIVDNVSDTLSSNPRHVDTELGMLSRRGKFTLSGECLCCAAHGLSLLITTQRGSERHSVLFDTGPESYAFGRNVRRLGLDLTQVETIVLSHGHWDHAGGMVTALNMIQEGNPRQLPFYAHPDMFRSRAMKLPDGSMREMQDVPDVETLESSGAKVINTTEPQLILDDHVFISGEIPRVTTFETGMPNQYRRTENGKDWEPDTLIMDERFVAINVAGKGIVVFTACSHAGVINVLKHAQTCFPETPLHAVIGGFHLSGPSESIIPETVEALIPFGLSLIAPSHCTGWRAVGALANAFGDRIIVPGSVGKRYTFKP